MSKQGWASRLTENADRANGFLRRLAFIEALGIFLFIPIIWVGSVVALASHLGVLLPVNWQILVLAIILTRIGAAWRLVHTRLVNDIQKAYNAHQMRAFDLKANMYHNAHQPPADEMVIEDDDEPLPAKKVN